MMFKSTLLSTLVLSLVALLPTQASAWEQHSLPASSEQSSTAHYGGNKAPLVLSTKHIMAAAANAQGMFVWNSLDDGNSWSASPLPINSANTQAFLASDTLALAWSDDTAAQLFHYSTSSSSWSATAHVSPLASTNIIDVSTSTAGKVMVLATQPVSGKLVEGALYVASADVNGWSDLVLLSAQEALVGDAAVVIHASGLQSVIWSQRQGNGWEIVLRNSSDGVTWGNAMVVEQHIAAPFFQESAVQLAADALNQDEIALAFTGWENQAHSQLWSKAVDAVSGVTTQIKALLPDAGDMVHQPSLVSIGADTWAVAWQQSMGIDAEILVAQHQANGMWTHAVNVSADSSHMDRDPHIALGSSHTVNVAFTRRVQADVVEVYMFAEGDINDSALDSDGDGIADSQELGFDMNHDGIDDAFSTRVATWSNTDGRYALIVEGNGELSQVQAPSFAETGFSAPQTHHVSGSLFAFEIIALNAGETTQVHMVTPTTLADDVTWLKLNNAQWADSEAGTVRLDAEHTGLMIRLTDGGAGDEDGLSNGVIVDPAVLATPTVDVQVESSVVAEAESQAKSCVAPAANGSPLLYVMGLMMMLGLMGSRQAGAKQ
ncbi:MAG: choice-of-anchor U domain-containing protein [Ghiorsea sp.]